MGAWGSGALENDTALDFVDSLKRARKAARIVKLGDVLRDYVQFEERRRAGANVSAPTPEEVAALRRDLRRVRDYYTQPGQKLPLVTMPWLASAEAEQAYVVEMTRPRVEDGIDLAARAIAAAALLAATLEGADSIDAARCLQSCAREELIALVSLARDCLQAIPANQALIDSWGSKHSEALFAQIAALDAALQNAS